jgi:hypothetical protein
MHPRRAPVVLGIRSTDLFAKSTRFLSTLLCFVCSIMKRCQSLMAMLQGMLRAVIVLRRCFRVCRAVGRRCWEITDEEFTEYAKGDVHHGDPVVVPDPPLQRRGGARWRSGAFDAFDAATADVRLHPRTTEGLQSTRCGRIALTTATSLVYTTKMS